MGRGATVRDAASEPEPVVRTPADLGGAAPDLPADSASPVQRLIDAAASELSQNRPVAARELLNRALHNPEASATDQAIIRAELERLNEDLLFSPRIYADDPLAVEYVVQPGDVLSRLPARLGLATEWQLIQRINRIGDPKRIRAGQRLKVVPGPFHAVVRKSAYRLDLYAGPPDEPARWMYIRSFEIGLGADDSTPEGTFVVRPESKLVNPRWTNPRTGQTYAADDPDNPIGEHWVGLDGIGDAAAYTGYGLHGTIEPESIGAERSMGCIRLRPEDIALLYELLTEGVSVVHIEG